MKTSADLLREAFQALLAGDTHRRDVLCAAAEIALEREQRVRDGGPIFTEPEIFVPPAVICLPYKPPSAED